MAYERTPNSPKDVVTPNWLRNKQRIVNEVFSRRLNTDTFTRLLVPAGQHPLTNGKTPGTEFTIRLQAAADRFNALEGNAAFFLPGSRHHDSKSNQTDQVALYDAAGLWLVDHGIPADKLHGRDWIDEYQEDRGLYSGAEEIQVAASGYYTHPEFLEAEYFCSSDQVSRARIYGLAFELPLSVTVPKDLRSGGRNVEQLHHLTAHAVVLNGLARTVDPYGDRILHRMTRDRIPADGNMDTTPAELASNPDYQLLSWHQPSY